MSTWLLPAKGGYFLSGHTTQKASSSGEHNDLEKFVEREKLTRAFYTRNTLLVARELLGKYLVHHTPDGIVRGRIVETEAYAGIYDPGSHTYRNQQTERNRICYGEGGYAYVYQIYGSYFCLGIITEPAGIPGAVLIRALEPTDGLDLLLRNNLRRGKTTGKETTLCNGPAKLCIAMAIDKRCNHLDLCGEICYLEDGVRPALEEIGFSPRINIDYAGAGALSAWRYFLRRSIAISKKSYEPLRSWRVKGYPSLRRAVPHDLLTHLAQSEACSQMNQDIIQMVKDLPKVELHVHLEGCMTLPTLRTLAAKNHRALPVHLADRTSQYFGTFDEFVHAYASICNVLVQEQDFRLLIADIAAYLQRNHVLYCELSWTPFLYLNNGLSFQKIMEVLNLALDEHQIRDRVNFLIDVQRDHGLEAGTWVYEQVFAARDLNIVGIGLTGQEEGFAPAEYQALYQRAREAGLGLTAHAGEYGSAEDIWQCVRHLQVSRIGHGIRAIEDRALMSYLAEHAIHLEMCPSSNVRLQRCMSYSNHPLHLLWTHHINLGINSDDPALFGMEITDEYLKVLEHCGFRLDMLKQTVLNSIASSFARPAQKQGVAQQIARFWREDDAH